MDYKSNWLQKTSSIEVTFYTGECWKCFEMNNNGSKTGKENVERAEHWLDKAKGRQLKLFGRICLMKDIWPVKTLMLGMIEGDPGGPAGNGLMA